jgi:hypothetical protein
MTKVVHCKEEDYDVYIGRPSKWGNPFKIGANGNREGVIFMYEEWLRGNLFQDVEPEKRNYILKNISGLKNKTLGCWCKPKSCHGDILARMANE